MKYLLKSQADVSDKTAVEIGTKGNEMGLAQIEIETAGAVRIYGRAHESLSWIDLIGTTKSSNDIFPILLCPEMAATVTGGPVTVVITE